MDRGTGTQKQHRAMVDLVERKIRLRAHQLYEERGHVGGFALEDWLKAESEVLKTSILAPLYRRSRNGDQTSSKFDSGRGPEPPSSDDADAHLRTRRFSSIARTTSVIRLGTTLSDEMKSESQNTTDAVGRPLLTSYDSGYEHSLDHWIELQHLVREAEGGFPPLAVEADRLASELTKE